MEEKGINSQDAWAFWKSHWRRISMSTDRGRDNPKKGRELPKVRTPGVLKSTTPRPMYMYDREIEFDGKTSQSDKNRAVFNPNNPNWTQQNPETPFVASFSGHTIFYIGLIKSKMEDLPIYERQDFFNTMLKSFIAVYLSQGFHSFKEISEMINDPRVLQSLNDTGIEVDLGKLFFGPDGVLDKTFADAIDYNKIYLLSKSVQEELKLTAQESNNDSEFVDPRETYLAERAKQKATELSEEIEAGDITTEEALLREKLLAGEITPEQAVEQMPNSEIIGNIALSMNFDILASLNMKPLISLYKKGRVTYEDLAERLAQSEAKITTSNVRFVKKDNALTKENKLISIKQNLYKLHLAYIEKNDRRINSLAIALLKSAGTVRNKLTPFKGEYSTSTTSSKSLIKALQHPDNANILKALKIDPNASPKNIEKELIKMMKQAYKDQDVISLERTGPSPSDQEEINFFST